MRTLQISIPTPCHEDWNKMSPQEQGRFCDKCCKTVVDFSNKSPLEVQEILLSRANEKMCGRFKTDQLRKPVRLNIPFQSIGNRLSAAQVFFVALLFAFGTTLFSCTTHKNETVGKLSLTEWDYTTAAVDSDSMVTTTGVMLIEVPEIPFIEEEEEPAEVITCTEQTKLETQFDTSINLPEVEVSESSYAFGGSFMVGGIGYTIISSPDEEFLEPDSIEASKTADENPLLPAIEPAVLYPNPSQSIVNLKLNLGTEKNVQAELFDMQGKLVRTIIPAQLMQAETSETQFDISDLPPATYIVRIVMGEEVVVKRVVRG